MRHPVSRPPQTGARAARASRHRSFRSIARWLGAVALYYTGLYHLYARFRDSWLAPCIVIVMYHRIRCGPRPAALTKLEEGVDFCRFREHVRALRAVGPLRTVCGAWDDLRAGRRRSSVAITFDDAYRDILPAVEYLVRSGHTCTVYAVVSASKHGELLWWDRLSDIVRRLTNRAEGERGVSQSDNALHVEASSPGSSLYLNVSELRELARRGVEIGGHSARHPFLGRVSQERLHREIEESKRFLSREVGIWPVSFAYPHGSWSEAARKAVLDAGFCCAVTTHPGIADRTDDPAFLPRVPAGDETAATLALRIVRADLARVWRRRRQTLRFSAWQRALESKAKLHGQRWSKR